MSKEALTLDDFLADISPEFEAHVRQIDQFLTEKGLQISLQLAKSGHVVSYTDPSSKKVVANFVSRKKGPTIRIYADNVSKYNDVIEALPADMLGQIAKTGACRRLLDPTKCNAHCPMGYVFTIGETEHKKCRYNCFMLLIDAKNTPHLIELLDHELAHRAG